MSIKIRGVVSALALGAFIAPVLAQENPTPSRSIESYQSWTVECSNIAIPPKEDAKEDDPKFRKLCEVIQTYTNQKTGNEVARMAFAYTGEDKKKRKLVGGLRTLVDVSFEKRPEITVDGKVVFEGKLSRCAGIYCFGQFELDKKKMDSFKTAEKAAVQYPVSNGRVIRINISTNGLADALTALETK